MADQGSNSGPVQPGGSTGLIAALGIAALAALLFWGWQNRGIDPGDLTPPRRIEAPASTPAAAPVAAPGIARPKASLASYVRDDDYPKAAIRNEEQGTTGFLLEIGRNGQVRDCTVTLSSGSKALDRATCRIMSRRARFEPARDASGKRVRGSFSARIRWVLPPA